MTWLHPTTLLAVFLIQCRVGACLMIMPGFGSSRIPRNVRLFLSLAVSIGLAPLLLAPVLKSLPDTELGRVVLLITTELLTGVTIGFIGRIFMTALETMGNYAATFMNLAAMGGSPLESDNALPPMVNIITMTAIVMIFISGLHWQLISGLVSSFSVIPPGLSFDAQGSLIQFVDSLTEAFLVALRVSSPFVLYSVLANLSLGLMNKFTPQIPVYFVSMPFILMGGLLLTMFVVSEMVGIFIDAFSLALSR
ncbi:flagellar biosynthetic protein FliR [uncultured Cohaesibacter sp.]|uniref:flagellar biosynthetic protein FliR n=1 Tax=uncultured Cohaesibacter sp. TaxID=1002546 RepID=UPI0029C608DD|nr:flagellar biosynthetic protein FliR [uncultured Cohaesibacter sp.]